MSVFQPLHHVLLKKALFSSKTSTMYLARSFRMNPKLNNFYSDLQIFLATVLQCSSHIVRFQVHSKRGARRAKKDSFFGRHRKLEHMRIRHLVIWAELASHH